MAEQGHTPTPWEHVHFDGPDSAASGQVRQVLPEGHFYNLAIFRNLADAEFAVRACNSHDALLAALERIAGGMSPHDAAIVAKAAICFVAPSDQPAEET